MDNIDTRQEHTLEIYSIPLKRTLYISGKGTLEDRVTGGDDLGINTLSDLYRHDSGSVLRYLSEMALAIRDTALASSLEADNTQLAMRAANIYLRETSQIERDQLVFDLMTDTYLEMIEEGGESLARVERFVRMGEEETDGMDD